MTRARQRARDLILLGLLSGCAASATAVQFVGPDGSRDWWAVDCHGDGAKCWRQADDACPKGYDVAERSLSDASPGKSGGLTILPTKPTSLKTGELVVRCKGPSAPGMATDPACKRAGEPRMNHCYDQDLARQETGREYLPPPDAGALPVPTPSAQLTATASALPAPSAPPLPAPPPSAPPPAPSGRPRPASSAAHRP